MARSNPLCTAGTWCQVLTAQLEQFYALQALPVLRRSGKSEALHDTVLRIRCIQRCQCYIDKSCVCITLKTGSAISSMMCALRATSPICPGHKIWARCSIGRRQREGNTLCFPTTGCSTAMSHWQKKLCWRSSTARPACAEHMARAQSRSFPSDACEHALAKWA